MRKVSLKRIMLLTILVGIGMNFHHPVTPTLITELGLPSRIFGTSYAVMCFASFLTSPFWGEMSDRIGRIKVFAFTCILYGVAQFFLGFSDSEISMLLSRAMAGAFSGGAAIATMSYIVDISPIDKRAKNIAIYTAMQGISLAVGYLIGGVLGTISYKLAFNAQAVWMAALGIFGYLTVAESYKSEEKQNVSDLIKSVNPFSSFTNAGSLLNKMMVLFLGIAFLTAIATSCYDNAFNYYIKDQLHFIPAYNGILKAVIGLIGLAANFTINMWIVRKTNVYKSLTITLIFCAVSTLGALISNSVILFIIFNIIFFTVNAIYLPIIQAVAVEGRKSQVVGIITGILNSVRSMGQVFGSLLAGFVYEVGVLYPFILGGMFFLLSVFFAYGYYKLKMKQA